MNKLSIPYNRMYQIALALRPDEIVNLFRVNSIYKRVFDDDRFWIQKYRRDVSNIGPDGYSYREAYLKAASASMTI